MIRPALALAALLGLSACDAPKRSDPTTGSFSDGSLVYRRDAYGNCFATAYWDSNASSMATVPCDRSPYRTSR